MGMQEQRGRPLGRSKLGGTLTPAAMTGDVNNYNPTGLSNAAILRLEANGASRDVTGIEAGFAGQRLVVVNIDATNNVVLKHDSASSSAGNKIYGPNSADVTIRPNGSVELHYDAVSAVWRARGA